MLRRENMERGKERDTEMVTKASEGFAWVLPFQRAF